MQKRSATRLHVSLPLRSFPLWIPSHDSQSGALPYPQIIRELVVFCQQQISPPLFLLMVQTSAVKCIGCSRRSVCDDPIMVGSRDKNPIGEASATLYQKPAAPLPNSHQGASSILRESLLLIQGRLRRESASLWMESMLKTPFKHYHILQRLHNMTSFLIHFPRFSCLLESINWTRITTFYNACTT